MFNDIGTAREVSQDEFYKFHEEWFHPLFVGLDGIINQQHRAALCDHKELWETESHVTYLDYLHNFKPDLANTAAGEIP